jgi:hypothetical protein
MIDDALYNFFNDSRNSKLLTDVDELAKIIDNFNLFDPATNLLNDETDDLDDG